MELDNPRPAYLGASALLTVGDYERAREWTARALAIDPDDILVQYNVACIYARLGELEKALDLLERSLPRTGPEWTRWIRHHLDLDSLRNHSRFHKILEQTKQVCSNAIDAISPGEIEFESQGANLDRTLSFWARAICPSFALIAFIQRQGN